MKTPNLGRLIRTLGPLPVAMHGARVLNIARKKAWRPALPALVERWRRRAVSAAEGVDRDALLRLGAALDGDVRPLGEPLAAGTLILAGCLQGPFPPADWKTTGNSPLERYEGAYLEWFEALVSVGTPDALSLAEKAIASWRVAAPHIAIAWEPYPRARRVLACLRAAARLVRAKPSAASNELIQTALQTAATAVFALDALLERHLDGNHLLVDHLALAAADAAFGAVHKRPADWIGRATTMLNAQLHSDGAHVEGSPMYHALVTEDALTVAALAGDRAPGLQASVERAVAWTAAVVHPDGSLPAFGDTDPSSLRACPLLQGRVVALSASTNGPPIGRSDPHSSAFVAHTDRFHVVVHTAQPAWTKQPGHAHDDALSIELSVDGRLLVADAGLCGYEGDDRRPWNRSAAAHSTVQLDGAPGLELWASFRVGARGRVEVLDHVAKPGSSHCLARHLWDENRFSHDRLVAVFSGEGDAAPDRPEGVLIADGVATGRHVTARLRLAHGVNARLIDGHHAVLDPSGVHVISNTRLDIRPDRRFPERGQEAPCQAIVYHPRVDDRTWLFITRGRPPAVAAVQSLLASITARW